MSLKQTHERTNARNDMEGYMSLSELTPMIFNIGLTLLGPEAYIYMFYHNLVIHLYVNMTHIE